MSGESAPTATPAPRATASHVLRVANSAFYAGLSSVATLQAAVLRLGLDQLVSIAVVCAQKGQFVARDPQLQRLMSQLWQHSVAVAFASRWLAERVGYKTQAGERRGRSHNVAAIEDSSPMTSWCELVNNACTKLGLNLYRQDGVVLAATPEASGLGLKEVLIAELEIMLEDGVQTLAI